MEIILRLPVPTYAKAMVGKSITSKPTDREAGKGLRAGRGASFAEATVARAF